MRRGTQVYRTYRQKRRSRRNKNIVVSLITVLILIIFTVVIKGGYGRSLGPSSAYTTLAYQPHNIQPGMDIKAIQTSLEDVLKQYQEVINSTSKMNKDTLVSEVDKLYSIAANDNTNMKSSEVSSNNKQIIDDLTQGSDCLAASLFEIKDSLIYDGDFSATQLQNSKDDLTLAIKNLEMARQD
jgi:t-SNARE complex subunit (syntaxin)